MASGQTFTRSMAGLHGWAGLLPGWLLFAIFLTGTLTVFDREISWWASPQLQAVTLDAGQAATLAQRWLEREQPEAAAWEIGLPVARAPLLTVSAGDGKGHPPQILDPQSGQLAGLRSSEPGRFLFRFHYSLQLPRMPGIWIVGLAAMAMLVVLVSGLVIHKRIFRDFFTFRPVAGRRGWLDGHNACAVLLLPFHLMMTYTGLVIFVVVYMPAAIEVLYGGDREALFREARPLVSAPEPARSTATALQPLSVFVRQAEQVYGRGQVAGLRVERPGQPGARVEVRPESGWQLALGRGVGTMTFDAASGQVVQAVARASPGVLAQQVMTGLHFAQFGGYPMRWLYFLCGLGSCVMIASGLVLFVLKQRLKVAESGRGHAFLRLAETLNLAVTGGLLLACAGLLWASRLLPADGLEPAFWVVWLLALLHAAWRSARPLQGWREQLGGLALLALGLPLLELLTRGGVAPDRGRLVLGLVVALFGLLLLVLLRRLARVAEGA